MIIRPAPNWFRMLFVWHGSVLKSIIPQLAFMTLVSLLAMYTHGRIFGEKIPLNTTPFTLCGVALTIFLAFRNNASYERYWEARRLWGNALIAARALVSQFRHYVPPGSAPFENRRIPRLLVAFAYALKHQLRHSDPGADLARLLGPEQAAALAARVFQPVMLLDAARRHLAALNRAGALCDTKLWMLDHQLNELGATVGGCERILSTPLPFAYGVLLHRTVYAYCALLPFGLIDSIGFATPLVCVFVSYTLLALEAIAGEISDPFGLAPNNLALDAITLTIERSVLELCDEALPPAARPGPHYQLT
ncbi:putative membrane protein [Paraburkholderia bannensis]|uniref:Putative membrane protein n=1 Tax=Paraburkholderia bannensis TaxID=765414 RepID=A0A7W9U1Y5_9BURK|nr:MULTISPECIES: bestrophin family ion channel [Paraburkholderia]MBB3259304.1 putative membrane protein [Paraburkholderia sp. WP4_3_2]MBB6104320.1 putative membrane protein [Paraburkholderia bannensis]